MTILKNLVVTNGGYTDRDGNEKKRYQIIGQLHEGKNGNYITLDAHINLAAFPRKDGDTRVMVSLYDPKPRAEASKGPPRDSSDEPFSDEIPF